ncbi:T9SS type A sorting domain-containing protein [Flavobacterium subsaxonicum]|uniref:Secretion system C-terminal sorting domain-containing protein n=1 Tax=Flavobacterium subsaxonicum WB 4.1-42 = DSM 21790 TaxID=1121898 RepID=A0A0A2MPV6_9FLAO|nr:T9SS type A sorting domain-containing protein [Flavobacterium subsaxonicum]KGO94662.1 hypothetical protein Q766_00630 [Flavobacterium subsaxonicum WB 4.1-42 = DSM 21790]
MKKNFLFTILCTTITFGCYAQLNYLGLKEELTPPPGQYAGGLKPKIQVLDDYLYVPTYSGIYRKQLSGATANWELFAFGGQPVSDFVKNGDHILAITNKTSDSLMLSSVDNGSTFTDFTPEHFFSMENFNRLYRISQNKQNPNSIIVLHLSYGLSKSTDFGETWTNLNDFTGGFQDRYADFHPSDSLTIYYGGETEIFSSYIQHTSDGGLTWNRTDNTDNNCVHFIAADPDNPDLVLSASEGRITRSLDRGLTWEEPYWVDEYFYIYKILFEADGSGVIYAGGTINSTNNAIVVFRSVDEGVSWQIAYEEDLEDNGGIRDMLQYEGQLIFLTGNEGIYTLDINLLNTYIPAYKNFAVYPNPASSFLEYDGDSAVTTIIITDMHGRTVRTETGNNQKQHKIDISGLSQGTYLVTFHFEKGQITKKIVID